MKRCYIGFIIAIALAICAVISVNKTTQPQEEGFADTPIGEFTYEQNSPLDLLEFLKKKKGKSVVLNIAPAGWIRSDDIPHLVALLDHDEPCAAVTSGRSSLLTTHESTVGREARYLMLGFKTGRFPPSLGSWNENWNEDDARNWWRHYQQQSNGS